MKLPVKVTAAVLLLSCYCFNAEPIRRSRRREEVEPVAMVSSMLRTNEPLRDARTSNKIVRAISMEKLPASGPYIHLEGGDENNREHPRFKRSPDNDGQESKPLKKSRLRSNMRSLHDKVNGLHKNYDSKEHIENQRRIDSHIRGTDDLKDEAGKRSGMLEGANKRVQADLSRENVESKANEIYEIVRPYEEGYEERSRIDPSFEFDVGRIYQIIHNDDNEEEDEESKVELDKLMQDSVAFRGKGVNFKTFILFDFSNSQEQAKDVLKSLQQNVSEDDDNLGEADGKTED
ncbi:hypothetical protein ANCCAN_21085 [Ancylostoma caninum]|uniref:Uncharacterized protein n=1 Tax=Ancylostoma caninum TaxID=29170 RepID=A0A368FQ01_ANCCA|nr:hypothetical protein ANCCAN_21085 [Ancylostoma caninum]